MKILISSHLFYPSVGGIEQVTAILADGFVKRGNSVKVITQSPEPGLDCFSYPVIRQPSAAELLKTMKWCDLYFHNNISLQTAWPLVAFRRPWVIAHQTWLTSVDGITTWRESLKRHLLRFASNVAVSQAIARRLPVPAFVIGNPYRSEIFSSTTDCARSKELIFVGRLVSDKGLDVLVEALGQLRSEELYPQLTVVGDGPELPFLRDLVRKLNVHAQVNFSGAVIGKNLAMLLRQHQLMVVPSRWEEPFGIVALEAIACGCVVLGSEGGGLRDAIGPCGATFPNGDSRALAALLIDMLGNPAKLMKYRANAPQHLALFSQDAVVDRYLKVFSDAIAK